MGEKNRKKGSEECEREKQKKREEVEGEKLVVKEFEVQNSKEGWKCGGSICGIKNGRVMERMHECMNSWRGGRKESE